jgi:glycosyltransferase involved in cell wall biosynthesis
MINTTKRPSATGGSFWAVMNFPPRLGYPNGFSPRWHHFLRAVGELHPLDILALRRPDSEWSADEFLPPGFPACHFWCETVPHNPLSRPGRLGKLRRVLHSAFGIMPQMSYPRRVPRLKQRQGEHAPSLAIYFLPYMAHFPFIEKMECASVFVLEEGWERALERAYHGLPPVLRNWVLRGELQRVHRLYRKIGQTGAPVVVISEDEKKWFAQFIPEDRITVIAHGLDCEFFVPPQDVPERDVDIGVFSNFAVHSPDEALRLFAAAQEVREEDFRRLKWAFVGNGPPSAMLGLRSEDVQVTGRVADLRPYYARTKVVVVPTCQGTGVKTTILEAWAMGRPVVATSFALKGLPARPGENVLVGETPEDLLRHVRTLLQDPVVSARIAQSGLETVRRERDIKRLAEQFVAVCVGALSRR